jgi:hypothetical protein
MQGHKDIRILLTGDRQLTILFPNSIAEMANAVAKNGEIPPEYVAAVLSRSVIEKQIGHLAHPTLPADEAASAEANW